MELLQFSIYSTALKMFNNRQEDANVQERIIFGYFQDPAKAV
jgi:hypothetical protein